MIFTCLSLGLGAVSSHVPEPEVSVLVGVALRSFAIRAVHTVGCCANPTHLTQRQVICPALMLLKKTEKTNSYSTY